MRGQTALVTGAGGFLGGWLCRALLDAGARVIAFDRQFLSGATVLELDKDVERISGDICDFQAMLRLLNNHETTFVFHLAAQALVGIASRNPLDTFKSNVEGTWNILEAARVLNAGQRPLVKGVIVASSDKAYGEHTQLPYKEDFAMQGRYPYDVSKSCADLIARSYHASYRLPVCVTRCANLYGGGDFAFSRIVPGTIKSVLSGEAPLIRSDGSPLRDYLYVADAAAAMKLLAERMLIDPSIHGEAFNISSESPITVLELVEKILKLMDRSDLRPIIENRASGEIQAQYLSGAKLREQLSWRPQFDLDSGLKETISWYGKRADRLQPTEARSGQVQ